MSQAHYIVDRVYYAILRPDGRLQWGHRQSTGSPKLYQKKGHAKYLADWVKGTVIAVNVVPTLEPTSQT